MTANSKKAVEVGTIKEMDLIVEGIYNQVAVAQKILHSNVVKTNEAGMRLIEQAGGVDTDPSQMIEWSAVNQFDKKATDTKLPRFIIGGKWLGKISKKEENVPFIDDLASFTGASVTVFQRMNEAGDMLRVATSVINDKGTRAVGTYIPAKQEGGTANQVVSTVLSDRPYSGRAWVVNKWYDTLYTPLKDKKGNIIGMLFTGIPESVVTDSLIEKIQSIKIGQSGYPYVLNALKEDKGRYVVSFKGQRNGEMILGMNDSNGKEFIREITENAVKLHSGEKALIRYPWQNKDDKEPKMKQVRYVYFEPFDWVIAAGVYEDELYTAVVKVENESREMVNTILLVSLMALLISGICALLFGRSIANPVLLCVNAMSKLAGGDLTTSVDLKRTDELGLLANSINQSISQLRETVTNVAAASTELTESAHLLKETAINQAAGAEETNVQANTVAAAGEELATNSKAMAGAAIEITNSATTVAAAIEQMSASIQEVARNCSKESEIARDADNQARVTRELMDKLEDSAKQIGKIVELINRIADQTNLLALNATIEAASAGEAGRGFAVVANEVKELARQSASATEDIRRQVALIQENAKNSVNAIDGVAKVIEEVSHISGSIAAAVEEQSATTTEIVRSLHSVTSATNTLSENVQHSANGAKEVSLNIHGVSEAANESAKGAARITTSSNDVNALATRLNQLVSHFKV